MKTGWLTHAGPYKVEHVPVPHPGSLESAAYTHRKGVQHTTEGSALEGALARFRVETVGSTFIVGRDQKHRSRILQLIPLGQMAAALKHTGSPATNSLVIAQVELVGVSPVGRKWVPDPVVLDMLAALYWQLQKSCDIPLKHVANPSRSPAKWVAAAGWLGHVDVPENDHVDPRNLDYSAVIKHAHRFDHVKAKGKVKTKPRKQLPVGKTAALQRRAAKTPPAPMCIIP